MSKEHYEYSFGHLRLFRVKLAVTLIRALAFKMNFFSILKNSNQKSIFYGSNIFFNKNFYELENIINMNKYGGMFEEEILQDIILLDIRSSILIKAIHTFLNGDYKNTENLIGQINDVCSSFSEDTQFNIKFNLLQARLLRKQKQTRKAKSIYRELNFYIEESSVIKSEINEFLI